MLLKNKFYIIGIILSVLMFILGCDKTWDDHYNTRDTATEKDKIISEMEKIPEISKFTAAVKSIDTLEFLLGQNRLYTVFAPVNETFEQIDPEILNNETLFTRLILYHFIDGKYKYKDFSYDYIKTFNNKYLYVSVDASNTVLLDSNITIVQSDFLSQNGMIQVIEQPLMPTDNLYEYLNYSTYTSQFGEAIPNYTIKEFDQNASTPIGENENGDLIYDSVFLVTNPFLYEGFDWVRDEMYGINIQFMNISAENRWFTYVFPVNYEAALNTVKTSTFLNNSIADHDWAGPILATFLWQQDWSREEILQEIADYHALGYYDSSEVMLYFADLLENNYINQNILSNSTVHFVDGFEYDMSWLITNQGNLQFKQKEKDYQLDLMANYTNSDNVDSTFINLGNIKNVFYNDTAENNYISKYGEWVNFELEGDFYPVDYKIMVRGKNYASGTYMVEADGKEIGEYDFSTAPSGDNDTQFDEIGTVSFNETKSITNLKFTFTKTHPGANKGEQYLWIREIKLSPIIK